MEYTVQVIKIDTGKVVKEIKAKSFNHAVQIKSGFSINLNHEDYQIEIEISEEN